MVFGECFCIYGLTNVVVKAEVSSQQILTHVQVKKNHRIIPTIIFPSGNHKGLKLISLCKGNRLNSPLQTCICTGKVNAGLENSLWLFIPFLLSSFVLWSFRFFPVITITVTRGALNVAYSPSLSSNEVNPNSYSGDDGHLHVKHNAKYITYILLFIPPNNSVRQSPLSPLYR